MMQTPTRIMIGLTIPCIANVLMWVGLFTHPAWAFRGDLKIPIVAGWIGGAGWAIAGVVFPFADIAGIPASVAAGPGVPDAGVPCAVPLPPLFVSTAIMGLR